MDEETGYHNGTPGDEESEDEEPGTPDFLHGIPEAVFGKVIKSRKFRKALFARGADLRSVLRDANISPASVDLEQLQRLIDRERDDKTMSRLGDDYGPNVV
jgi:hypothetical protein